MRTWGAWGAAWALALALSFLADRWVYRNVAGAVAERTGEKTWRFDRPRGKSAPKALEVLTLFKRMGEFWFAVVVSGTMLFLAPSRRRQVVVLWLAIALAAAVGQVVLKHSIGKLRPDAVLSAEEAARLPEGEAVEHDGVLRNRGHALFRPFSWSHGGLTLPSGHSALAFAMAAVLGAAFPRARWWFLSLAGGVAASRVLMGEHFLSDVIAGSGVGYACAHALFAVPRVRRILAGSMARA
jgi:hypothetical protein